MDYYIYGVLFVFGLIIGSFLNVVILRLGTGISISRGRSKCFSCDKSLTWQELIPLLSFIAQGGRCKSCRSRISWQYPLIELLGALAIPLAYACVPGAFSGVFRFAAFAVTAAILCIYIVIAVYDMRHKIIPDALSYAAALAALVLIALSWWETGVIDLSMVVAGPSLFVFFYFFWFVSRGRWMGLGDAKLALSVGWLLGLSSGIAAVLMAFWIGAILSIIVILYQRVVRRSKSLGMASEVPFGPYIIIGFLISFIFHIDLAAILSFLAV